jgi:hypothetical protein
MTDVAWTFSAAGEITERWEWLTDLMRAATGPEQGRRLRISPRIFHAFDALEVGAGRRQMENALAVHGSDTWAVPLVQDGGTLTAAASTVSTTIELDTADRRFRVGGRVLLMADDPRTYDLGTVASIDVDALELEDPPAIAWPAGTRVVPVESAVINGMPSLARFTADAVPLRIEFRLVEPLDVVEDAGDATYRGLPVLEIRPDWSVEPTSTPEREQQLVDGGSGPVSIIDLPGIPLGALRVEVVLLTRAELAAFRSLLTALAGRWGSIWVPTYAQDLRVTGALVAASSTLDVEWSGLGASDLVPNRRDVRIALANGTVLYRRITDVDALGDDQERLTLDSALGVNAAAADVVSVSFLVLSRQDTDVNVLRHWSDGVVISELTFRGVLASGV